MSSRLPVLLKVIKQFKFIILCHFGTKLFTVIIKIARVIDRFELWVDRRVVLFVINFIPDYIFKPPMTFYIPCSIFHAAQPLCPVYKKKSINISNKLKFHTHRSNTNNFFMRSFATLSKSLGQLILPTKISS